MRDHSVLPYPMRDPIITSTILLLLSITPNLLQALQSDANCITRRYEVHVINNLPSNAAMRVHCASKDTELGYHTLGTNGDFHWRFCDNFFSTLFFCHLWWGSKDAAFEVFNGSIRPDCDPGNGLCYWIAKADGIYFSDRKDGNYVKMYDWGK